MTDSTSSKFHDVLLFKIDVRHGIYGMYNFYKMQVKNALVNWIKGHLLE